VVLINLEGLPLSEWDLGQLNSIVRRVGKWNRNAVTRRQLIVVTTSIAEYKRYGGRAEKQIRKQPLGYCYHVGVKDGKELKAVWLQKDMSPEVSVITAVHELCHAYSGPTISHEEAFRRFVTIATLTAYEEYQAVLEHLDPEQWVDELCAQYQRRNYSNPYEGERHLQAFKHYQERAK